MPAGNLGDLFWLGLRGVYARQAVAPGISKAQQIGADARSDLPNAFPPLPTAAASREIAPIARPRAAALVPTMLVAAALYVAAFGASAALDVQADVLRGVPVCIGAGLFWCVYARVALPDAVRTTRLIEAAFLVVALGLTLACLSYLGAMADLPLRDRDMMWIDRHLGFDWLQIMQALDHRPLALAVLDGAYATFTSQLIGTVLVLVAAGRTRDLDRFFLTFVCASVIAEAASVLVPTLGPMSAVASHADFTHLPTLGRTTADIVLKLRDGALRTIDLQAIDGIISFPSLHAAVSVIVPFSLRWNRPLFWPIAVLDGVMLVSAVPSGNHYLIDVIGGVGVAAIAILCSGPLQRSLERLSPGPVSASR
jgi:membrane-associated phospholipid phosphatase